MTPESVQYHLQQHTPHCPYCNHVLDGLTGVGHGQMPSAGDFSVCMCCGELLIFTVIGGEIGLRKPKARERKEARDDPVLQATLLNFKPPAGRA